VSCLHKEIKQMKQAFLTLAIAVCPLLSGLADEAPQPPPAPAIVAQFLGFSDVQATQFQQLLQSLQATVGGLQQQIGPKQQALDSLLSTAQPDPAIAGGLLLEIHALQQQLGQALQSYHESFLALLTADQKQKTQAVVQAAQLLPAVRAFAEVRLIEPPR
jgi:Spy/CpxP family protein refolding chaperone